MTDLIMDECGNLNLKKIKESLELAETLAKVSLMTPNSAKQRLVARGMELKFGYMDENSGVFVPPKELLMYLVRMGSFSSAPKILNDDIQDNDLVLPKNISRNELLQHCQKQIRVGHPIFKRHFKKTNGQEGQDYGFKFRKLNAVTKGCSDYITNPNSLRVFQWNILSQALGQMNDNFEKCPDEALEWNHRKFYIIEEIVEYCPDVICLQEVDHFNFIKNILKTQGYTGLFFPKPDSPCMYIHGNNGPDGCAIFYRTDKFDLINSESRILEIWRVQSNQVALLVNLKIKETGQEVSITTTHLKARKGALLSTLRNEQGKDLLNFVNENSGNRPVVLCGDFNAEPIEPVYSTILNSQNLEISSAYADCDNSKSDASSADREPPYTTWKIRDEGEICHTIDYIFYTKNNLEVESVLEFPTGEEIGEDRIPSFSYPSDHFSLVADFRLSDNKTVTKL